MGRDHEVRSYHFSKKKKTCLKNKKSEKIVTREQQRDTCEDLLWLSWLSLATASVPQLCPVLQLLFPECETPALSVVLAPFGSCFWLCVCVCFHEGLLFPPPVVRLWKRGTSIGIRSALCAPTATLTSNRRATSSWRGSCTAKLMPGPARGPQRATTQSPFIPKLKS